VMAGTDLFWRFSVSGLSTMFLVVIFLGLFWCLVLMEQAAREGKRGGSWWVMMAVLTGVIVGLGALTRYSFGWLILPVLGFFALYFGQRRAMSCLVGFVAFAAVLTPWLARNYNMSGTLFGTAGYAIVQDTQQLPGDRLQRSLKPDFGEAVLDNCRRKMLLNVGEMLREELPQLGGSVTTVFFLVGLMVPFVSVGLSRLRIFLLGSLAVLILVQALGRTHSSTDAQEINSENLLVWPAPLICMYGVGMYSLLLDRLELPFPQLRHVVTGILVLAASTPLIFLLLPPREFPLAYPPYFPPWVQQFARWMDETELIMSDMPWATAWYGRRQSVWTTLNVQDPNNHDDFYAINDSEKPVRALYLTPLSMDARFYSQMLKGQDWAWGKFVVDSLVLTNELPPGFPLKHCFAGAFNSGHVFLTDRPRWKETARGERGN
jgi:4-amino-4-deoxy-L-arabinose transferase-like glycosyltransferase